MSHSVEGPDWRGSQASPQGEVPGLQVKAGAQRPGSRSEPGGAGPPPARACMSPSSASGRAVDLGTGARRQGGCRHVGHTVWGDGTGALLAPLCGREAADQKAKAAAIVLSFEKNVCK